MAKSITQNVRHEVNIKNKKIIKDAFQFNNEKRERNTRQDHLYTVPRCQTEAGKRQFCVRATNLYNSLPTELHGMRQATFSRNLKQLLPNV